MLHAIECLLFGLLLSQVLLARPRWRGWHWKELQWLCLSTILKIVSESSWLHGCQKFGQLIFYVRNKDECSESVQQFVEAFPLQLDSTILSIVQRMLDSKDLKLPRKKVGRRV